MMLARWPEVKGCAATKQCAAETVMGHKPVAEAAGHKSSAGTKQYWHKAVLARSSVGTKQCWHKAVLAQ